MLVLALVTEQTWATGARGVAKASLAPLEHAMMTVASGFDRATSALGIPAETRAFSPHLTLARIKERLDLQPLREAIVALPSLDFGAFEVNRFFLYQSKLQRGGSVYTKLAEFPFSRS